MPFALSDQSSLWGYQCRINGLDLRIPCTWFFIDPITIVRLVFITWNVDPEATKGQPYEWEQGMAKNDVFSSYLRRTNLEHLRVTESDATSWIFTSYLTSKLIRRRRCVGPTYHGKRSFLLWFTLLLTTFSPLPADSGNQCCLLPRPGTFSRLSRLSGLIYCVSRRSSPSSLVFSAWNCVSCLPQLSNCFQVFFSR